MSRFTSPIVLTFLALHDFEAAVTGFKVLYDR